MIRASLLAGIFVAAAVAPAWGRDCRPVETAPGVRVPPPGCRAAADRSAKAAPATPRRERGVIDLGNGTKIRIHGRVRIEGGVTR